MAGRTAILVVNGFDRLGRFGGFDEAEAIRFPWIEVCLREVQRRSAGASLQLLVWDNSHLPEQREIARRHGAAVFPTDRELKVAGPSAPGLLEPPLVLRHGRALDLLIDRIDRDVEFVVTLDNDAFPVRDDWIEVLTGALDEAALTGIWRDEMESVLTPFAHPACLCMRKERLQRITAPFSFAGVQDVGQRITEEVLAAGEAVAPLYRSNARNAHFILGGVYGDIVYHHGAGSRRPVFRLTEGPGREEEVNVALREAVFSDLDGLVAALRGDPGADLALDWDRPIPQLSTAVVDAVAVVDGSLEQVERVPSTPEELERLEATYRPFAGAEAWQGVAVDTGRWDRYVDALRGARAVAPAEVRADIDDRMLRAAALDSAVLSGILAPSGELTAGVLGPVALDGVPPGDTDLSDAVGLFIECNRRALVLASEVAAEGRKVDQNLIAVLYQVVTEAQQTFSMAMPGGEVVSVELPRDRYKPVSNYVTIGTNLVPFCPASQVPSEMARFAAVLGSEAFSRLHPAVQVAYAHHTLAMIHPFADANGRVARTVASIFLLRAAGVPLLVFGDQWPQYRAALQSITDGKRQPAVDRFYSFALQAVDLATGLLSPAAARAVREAGVASPSVAERAAVDLVRDVLWVELNDILPTPRQGTLLALGVLAAPAEVSAPGYRPAGAQSGFHGVRLGLGGEATRVLVFVPVVAEDPADPLPVGIVEVGSGSRFEASLGDTSPFALEGVTLRLRAWVNRLLSTGGASRPA